MTNATNIDDAVERSMKIRKRERYSASPAAGLSKTWMEYQVVDGRKIVARFNTRSEANEWLNGHSTGSSQKLWWTLLPEVGQWANDLEEELGQKLRMIELTLEDLRGFRNDAAEVIAKADKRASELYSEDEIEQAKVVSNWSGKQAAYSIATHGENYGS